MLSNINIWDDLRCFFFFKECMSGRFSRLLSSNLCSSDAMNSISFSFINEKVLSMPAIAKSFCVVLNAQLSDTGPVALTLLKLCPVQQTVTSGSNAPTLMSEPVNTGSLQLWLPQSFRVSSQGCAKGHPEGETPLWPGPPHTGRSTGVGAGSLRRMNPDNGDLSRYIMELAQHWVVRFWTFFLFFAEQQWVGNVLLPSWARSSVYLVWWLSTCSKNCISD